MFKGKTKKWLVDSIATETPKHSVFLCFCGNQSPSPGASLPQGSSNFKYFASNTLRVTRA